MSSLEDLDDLIRHVVEGIVHGAPEDWMEIEYVSRDDDDGGRPLVLDARQFCTSNAGVRQMVPPSRVSTYLMRHIHTLEASHLIPWKRCEIRITRDSKDSNDIRFKVDFKYEVGGVPQ